LSLVGVFTGTIVQKVPGSTSAAMGLPGQLFDASLVSPLCVGYT
jgi:hypothetical protein